MKKQFAIVGWTDSCETSIDTQVDPTNEELEPLPVVSCGNLISDDGRKITIARDLFLTGDAEVGQVKRRLTIPRCAVRFVIIMTVNDEGRHE